MFQALCVVWVLRAKRELLFSKSFRDAHPLLTSNAMNCCKMLEKQKRGLKLTWFKVEESGEASRLGLELKG